MLVCEQGDGSSSDNIADIGIMIGPEGGWSDREKQLFIEQQMTMIGISDFTLRAETAAIASIAKLC